MSIFELRLGFSPHWSPHPAALDGGYILKVDLTEVADSRAFGPQEKHMSIYQVLAWTKVVWAQVSAHTGQEAGGHVAFPSWCQPQAQPNSSGWAGPAGATLLLTSWRPWGGPPGAAPRWQSKHQGPLPSLSLPGSGMSPLQVLSCSLSVAAKMGTSHGTHRDLSSSPVIAYCQNFCSEGSGVSDKAFLQNLRRPHTPCTWVHVFVSYCCWNKFMAENIPRLLAYGSAGQEPEIIPTGLKPRCL